MTFRTWRVIHRISTGILAALALLHIGVTPLLYETWSADTVWFLGAGLGLLLLALMNWSHVGLAPCDLPTARAVRSANVGYAVFGVGAAIAVPEPQAYVILVVLIAQAMAGRVTLRRAQPKSQHGL